MIKAMILINNHEVISCLTLFSHLVGMLVVMFPLQMFCLVIKNESKHCYLQGCHKDLSHHTCSKTCYFVGEFYQQQAISPIA